MRLIAIDQRCGTIIQEGWRLNCELLQSVEKLNRSIFPSISFRTMFDTSWDGFLPTKRTKLCIVSFYRRKMENSKLRRWKGRVVGRQGRVKGSAESIRFYPAVVDEGSGGTSRFIRRNPAWNLMQINAEQWCRLEVAGIEGGTCCRSFCADTRRYSATWRMKHRGPRWCVTVLYIPYRCFMQP